MFAICVNNYEELCWTLCGLEQSRTRSIVTEIFLGSKQEFCLGASLYEK